MSFGIVIGADAQPDTGFPIVIGTTGGGGDGTVLEFTMPDASIGDLVLALIIRSTPAVLAPTGWTKIVDGSGASGLFLDVFAHAIDASDIAIPGQLVRFASLTPQELQGQLLMYGSASETTVIEAIAGAAFTADTTPPSPTPTTQQAINLLVLIWTAAGAVTFTAPAGFSTIDTYSTAEISSRSILIAYRAANVTGDVPSFDAGASPAASGRSWALVLTSGPPIKPPELFDPVPGHIGLI